MRGLMNGLVLFVCFIPFNRAEIVVKDGSAVSRQGEITCAKLYHLSDLSQWNESTWNCYRGCVFQTKRFITDDLKLSADALIVESQKVRQMNKCMQDFMIKTVIECSEEVNSKGFRSVCRVYEEYSECKADKIVGIFLDDRTPEEMQESYKTLRKITEICEEENSYSSENYDDFFNATKRSCVGGCVMTETNLIDENFLINSKEVEKEYGHQSIKIQCFKEILHRGVENCTEIVAERKPTDKCMAYDLIMGCLNEQEFTKEFVIRVF